MKKYGLFGPETKEFQKAISKFDWSRVLIKSHNSTHT